MSGVERDPISKNEALEGERMEAQSKTSQKSGIYVIRQSQDANNEFGLLANIKARFERWRQRKTAEDQHSKFVSENLDERER